MLKVSVCIPTFNRYELLCKTLDSICSQTYANIEIIVSDNCSSDKTPTVAEKYSNVKYFRQSEEVNWYENWNSSLALAQGDLIAIYHDDDIYDERMIEECVNAFRENENAIMLHTASYHFKNDSIEDRFIRPQPDHPKYMSSIEYLVYVTRYWCTINCPTVMVRKEIYRKYRFNSDYLSADYDMWFKMLQNEGGIIYLNTPLMFYRQHGSIKTKIDNFKAIKQYKEMFLRNLTPENASSIPYLEESLNDLLNKRVLDEFNYKKIYSIGSILAFMQETKKYGFEISIFSLASRFFSKLFNKLFRAI